MQVVMQQPLLERGHEMEGSQSVAHYCWWVNCTAGTVMWGRHSAAATDDTACSCSSAQQQLRRLCAPCIAGVCAGVLAQPAHVPCV